MQRLDRTGIAAPTCLARFHYPANCWNDVTGDDRAEIRACLERMQGRRCAYCEGPLGTLGQHIEHFRRRCDFPGHTFVWDNLYWSCYEDDSCGRYKDHQADPFNYADLIDPCIDDPDNYFLFRSNGTISIRSGLSAAERQKANETLRVFNLNPARGRLRYMRQAAVAGYVQMADEAVEFTTAELKELFAEELTQASGEPFYTAVHHVLTEPL